MSLVVPVFLGHEDSETSDGESEAEGTLLSLFFGGSISQAAPSSVAPNSLRGFWKTHQQPSTLNS